MRETVPHSGESLTLLDACTVVNVYATRHMESVLTSIGGSVAVVDVVERESQYVFRGGSGDDAREREPIDLQPCIAQGNLAVIGAASEEELLTFVDLTQELDDGEAMTAALAIHRGYTVVTDDRKAIRVLKRETVEHRSTLDLIKTWSDSRSMDTDALRSVLINLRERGNYYPSRAHPLKSWWDTIFA